ncbi:hypothetical protein CAPI_03945 [Corynebacterium capitovis DSM 44611]|uniref:hypothetical protein n=1 Tax=Corynebacterium capitovis TaxID=131081 RepID=UPI000380CE28|nr:hypothetical protein [Corynebacterium capitovis]WKD57347.1 hypothetical protein CAPI_03945 [Corynebacterium capitovis DSM 44611]
MDRDLIVRITATSVLVAAFLLSSIAHFRVGVVGPAVVFGIVVVMFWPRRATPDNDTAGGVRDVEKKAV